jgi:amino acid adenylation domain-containing protein
LSHLAVERLDQWVTVQAERRPEAGAVVLGDKCLTYGQLESLSNRLAGCLIHGGCRQGDRVALLMPKSPEAIACIIGIYKVGCVYVPLDPSSPARRLATIMRSCQPRWILAAGPVAGLLDELFQEERIRHTSRVGWLDSGEPEGKHFRTEFSGRDLRAFSESFLSTPVGRHNPAHILYTSGSTGVPKGVVITHANVIHFVEWAVRYFDMRPGERISGHPPLYFDLSMFDVFGSFAAGGELHLVPQDLNMLPNKLADFIRTTDLAQWFSVPSVLNYMAKFDVVRFNDFPRLRRLLWCGEVFPTPALVYWMKRLPHVTFTNLYGPTETSIASTYYTLPRCPDDETAAVPIGTACPGEEVLVLGDDLRPVPPDDVGELCIRGVGLSPGYWLDPERTRAVFVPNPERPEQGDRLYRTGDLARVGRDGLVYFLGRVDSQIKSRGYRIELGEIEAALHALGDLREVAVVAIPVEGFEGTSIGCAYVPALGHAITPPALRLQLSRLLPSYMLPARWMGLRELPKTANGKIDRRRLSEMFQREEAVEPR